MGGPMMGGGGPGGKVTDENRKLAAFLQKNRGDAKFLVMTASAMEAAPIVVVTGEPVMAIGGFNGGDNALSLEQFKKLVAAGVVRYVLIGGGPMGGGGLMGMPPMMRQMMQQMNANGGQMPGGMPPMMGGGQMGGPGGNGRNAEIFAYVKKHGAKVDASLWRGTSEKERPVDADEVLDFMNAPDDNRMPPPPGSDNGPDDDNGPPPNGRQ